MFCDKSLNRLVKECFISFDLNFGFFVCILAMLVWYGRLASIEYVYVVVVLQCSRHYGVIRAVSFDQYI